MNILCLNVGSTSVKSLGFKMPEEEVVFKIHYKIDRNKNIIHFKDQKLSFKNKNPYQIIFKHLIDESKNISWDKIAHRFVHGMWPVKQPLKLSEKVVSKMKKYYPLLPLHLPYNVEGYLACKKAYPKINQYALFDHGCYQDIPEVNYLIPLPQNLVKKYQLRRFGYHGLSHEYCINELSKILKKPKSKLKAITLHLGGGSSISVFKNGKFIDTTMGMSALSGLPMTTRSGNVDPGVLFRILRDQKITPDQLESILYKDSGLKAVHGKTGDMKTLLENYSKDPNSKLAVDYYVDQIVKKLSGFIVNLGNVDAINFAGGIGENAIKLRSMILSRLKIFGVKLDFKKNQQNQIFIHQKNSSIKISIIPCQEELQIAKKL
jgi:acetate kinase